jgi:hypothetical protein
VQEFRQLLGECLKRAAELDWGGRFFSPRTLEEWYYAYRQEGFSRLQTPPRSDSGLFRACLPNGSFPWLSSLRTLWRSGCAPSGCSAQATPFAKLPTRACIACNAGPTHRDSPRASAFCIGAPTFMFSDPGNRLLHSPAPFLPPGSDHALPHRSSIQPRFLESSSISPL